MGRAERIVKKHTRGRRGKKECERARGEMTATGWKTKYVSHCAIFSYFPPLLFRKYWYSVPEGTFWISTKIFQVQSEPTTHLRGGFFYTRSLIKWFGEAERSCDWREKMWCPEGLTRPRWTSNISRREEKKQTHAEVTTPNNKRSYCGNIRDMQETQEHNTWVRLGFTVTRCPWGLFAFVLDDVTSQMESNVWMPFSFNKSVVLPPELNNIYIYIYIFTHNTDDQKGFTARTEQKKGGRKR